MDYNIYINIKEFTEKVTDSDRFETDDKILSEIVKKIENKIISKFFETDVSLCQSFNLW